ncbi:MAG: Mpo1-like protein [Luteimonas sp.]
MCGCGFAWIGHFFREKPASEAPFRYPLYSFAGDWVMFKDVPIGRSYTPSAMIFDLIANPVISARFHGCHQQARPVGG